MTTAVSQGIIGLSGPQRGFALVLAAAVALVVVAGIFSPSFVTFANLLVIVRAASMTGIVAVAMSYVTISGNLFALSASSLGALIAVTFAILANHLGVGAAMAVALAAAIVCGFAQGVAVSVLGNPIIATLAFGTVFRGLAALFSGNSIIRIDSAFALWLGTARPLGIPTQSWIFVLVALLSWFVVRKTRMGRELVLCGANPLAARASGLRLGLMSAVAFIALAVGVAIVAILTVCQFSQAKADLYEGYDFDYIAAVLVGGVALSGGRGTPLQAAFGAILIALLQNFMLLNGLSAGLRMAIVGALVAVAISIFHVLQGRVR